MASDLGKLPRHAPERFPSPLIKQDRSWVTTMTTAIIGGILALALTALLASGVTDSVRGSDD